MLWGVKTAVASMLFAAFVVWAKPTELVMHDLEVVRALSSTDHNPLLSQLFRVFVAGSVAG